MAELPIFWTTTEPNYNDRDRNRRYMKDGKRVVEKVPQSGHVGTYSDRKRAPGVRYVTMVNSAGNTVSVVLTNGAAHMDPNTAYGQYVKRKSRALAWFGIGECPCALLRTGEVHADGFLTEEVCKGEPCQAGSFDGRTPDGMCPHAKAERAARQAEQTATESERAEKMKGKEDKILELLANQAVNAADKDEKILELLKQMGVESGQRIKQRRKDDE